MNPVVTRKSEATRSLSNLPVRTSSPKPFATASGDGKTDAGKTCNSHRADQTAIARQRTSKGRRRVLVGSGFSVIRKATNKSHRRKIVCSLRHGGAACNL